MRSLALGLSLESSFVPDEATDSQLLCLYRDPVQKKEKMHLSQVEATEFRSGPD